MVVLTVALVLAGMLSAVLPGSSAGTMVYPNTFQWKDPAYYGYDAYYGNYVYEYTENTQANLSAWIQNFAWYTSGDATMKSATLRMDWGAQYAATDLPGQVDYNKGAPINFSFTVPSTSVATNLWQHDYQIVVEFQTKNVQHKYQYVPFQSVSYCNGFQTDFTINSYVQPGSVKLYLVNYGTGSVTDVAASAYTAGYHYYNTTLAFTTAPASGNYLYAQYSYLDTLGQGDGVKTDFWLGEPPVAPGSEAVYLYNQVTDNVATAALVRATDYTIDNETGRIGLVVAPLPYQYVLASYEGWESSTWYGTAGGDNFVVLSADQASSNQLHAKWDEISSWYGNPNNFESAEAKALAVKALGQDDLAGMYYEAGNFALAKSNEQLAVDNLQAAIDKEVVFTVAWEQRNVASDNADLAYQQAGTANLNAQAARTNALLDAEKAKLKAEASKAKGYPTFLTLVGVGALFAGIAGMLWGVSKVLVARKAPPA